MSHTLSTGDAAVARQTRALLKKAGAKIAGKKPGSSPVRRDSYDVEDSRAKIGRPLGDGSKAQAIVHREALLDVAHELYQRDCRTESPDQLQKSDLLVFRAVLHFLDFRTGRLDPSHQTIANKAGVTRNTVIAAMKRLRFHGLIEWVRRTVRIAGKGIAGPQQAQTSNAYGFDFRRKMASGTWHRFWQLLSRKLTRLGAGKPKEPPCPAEPASPALAAALAGLGAAVAGAST